LPRILLRILTCICRVFAAYFLHIYRVFTAYLPPILPRICRIFAAYLELICHAF
jgi:hypothetical protein